MKRIKILLIDDDQFQRTIFQAIFRNTEFEVQCIDDAFNAIELCKCNRFDIIITDKYMPNLNGIDFLRVFHNTTPWYPKGVILMTAYTEENDSYIVNDIVKQECKWMIWDKSNGYFKLIELIKINLLS